MDELVQKAFENADFMATMASQKIVLKEELSQNLIFYKNGGSFTVSKELIVFLKTIIDMGKTTFVLIDDNDTPIEIEDLNLFFDNVSSVYFESVNEYYTKYNLLTKQRKVSSLIDFYD